jgi:hypothetical protein
MNIHGWLMWFSWTFISILQISTNRYLKHHWKYAQAMHNTLGMCSGVMTISAFVLIMHSKNWVLAFHQSYHMQFGVLSMLMAVWLIVQGLCTWCRRSKANEWGS